MHSEMMKMTQQKKKCVCVLLQTIHIIKCLNYLYYINC